MRKTLFINASPRPSGQSNSRKIAEDIKDYAAEKARGEQNSEILDLPRKDPAICGDADKILEILHSAEQWVLVLPLYVDALPGHLCRWLKRYEQYASARDSAVRKRIYGVANCGFPEPVQNEGALGILRRYARTNDMDWRFGIGLGMGTPYRNMAGIPLGSRMKSGLRKAFDVLTEDMAGEEGGEKENIYTAVKFPAFLYTLMGSFEWRAEVRKHGLKPRDLYRRPLLNP